MEDRRFREQLLEIFSELSSFIDAENRAAVTEGSPTIPKQIIRVVGQTALILAQLPFSVTATMDLDIISSLNYSVSKKLSGLLIEKGLRLETDGHLIWMPQATEYILLAEYPYVEVSLAGQEFVLASKLRFNRPKDKNLIKTYLQYFPDSRSQLEYLARK